MKFFEVYRVFAEQDTCITSEACSWQEVEEIYNVDFRKNKEYCILREKNVTPATKLFCIIDADITKPVRLTAWTFLDSEKKDQEGNPIVVHMGKITNVA